MYLSLLPSSASLLSPAGCLANPALSPYSVSSSSIASPGSTATAPAAAWSGFDVRASPEVCALGPLDHAFGASVDDLVWVGVLSPS